MILPPTLTVFLTIIHSFTLFQAYIEKYKFTSVVAQDLLDSFLNFFPELKEQSVDNKAGGKERVSLFKQRLLKGTA